MSTKRISTLLALLLACGLWFGTGTATGTPNTKTAANNPPAKTQAAAKAQAAAPVQGGPATEAVDAYRRGEFAKAKGIWEKLASQGDAQAMNNLGVLYDLGQGVEPDLGRALNYFAQSAKAGHASGMSNYARMLEQGRGIAANPEEAARWFDQAARKGQAEAQYNLGMMYEQGRGVPKDAKAAAAWYSRAASQQQGNALARLGHLYREGSGVSKDVPRATLLLYAAAMLGQAEAIRELVELAKDNPPKAEGVLFGLRLDNADRQQVRGAMQKVGVVATRQDDNFICDLYDARKAIPGSQQMAVCYGPGQPQPLGFLKIDYEVKDKARSERIFKMIQSRFGDPSAGEGEDSHLWNLGTVMVATQYAPTHNQMSLMYMVPRVYHMTTGEKVVRPMPTPQTRQK